MSLLTPTTDSLQGRPRRTRPAVSLVEREAKRLGLRLITRDLLSIRRRRAGKRWTYLADDDRIIRDTATIRRLDRLAVPPAYREVLYAEDGDAHLQAVGRDAAGRLQYRYHPKWERVRELRKARRLARLAAALPQVNQKLGYHLGADEPKLSFACAAVIELVAHTAIRPGNEAYARLRGTRGAATLLKSNVAVEDTTVTLTFRAKGGKNVIKQVNCARLAKAIVRLTELPGRRLFQYRSDTGEIRTITTREVNAFLRTMAGVDISLKDFRTLLASASVLDALSRAKPAESERQRRKQVLQAIRAAADQLANTPAICRKSYVHARVVEAFEEGTLERFAQSLKSARSPRHRAAALAQIIAVPA